MLDTGELPVEVVIVSSTDNARTYYAKDGTRTCHSVDGVAPCSDSKEPQSKKCTICFHNQWGSKITPNGKRGKGCSEFSQLQLLQPDTPHDMLSLRVPSASLKALRDYTKSIISRGERLNCVVTKIDATQETTRTQLTFRVIRFLEDGELNNLIEASKIAVSSFTATDGYTH